tara:strand:+ start:2985 stop:3740 length:756 start_codon:yes stop_codon:yes gene_type:complete
MNQQALDKLLQPIHSFLSVQTPQLWVDSALHCLDHLLIDHANCELKAAQTAVALLRQYALTPEQSKVLLNVLKPYESFVYRQESFIPLENKNHVSVESSSSQTDFEKQLIEKMLRLIKEELHHFEQVIDIMQYRNLTYDYVPAGRYAKGLMRHVRHYEPQALVDKLIIGAIIEARSCERFAKLAPHLDQPLQSFYFSLLRSEARHYQDYLFLAQQVTTEPLAPRIAFFLRQEAELITSTDPYFCFHSGLPA